MIETTKYIGITTNEDGIIQMSKEDLDFLIQVLNQARDSDGIIHVIPSEEDRKKTIASKIHYVLTNLGVRQGILGYDYLKAAIHLALDDPTYIREMTCRMYPEVAKIVGSKASRVERAIRHAIEVAFDNPTNELREKIFGNSTDWNRGKPTNTHFIAAVVEYINDAS